VNFLPISKSVREPDFWRSLKFDEVHTLAFSATLVNDNHNEEAQKPTKSKKVKVPEES